MFRVRKKMLSTQPDNDAHAEIIITNHHGQSMVVAELTWHRPNRLDAMVEELNAVARKYDQLR